MNTLIEELTEVYDECRNPDWDGYGAVAVEQRTVQLARQLIESLPVGFPRPLISAEPDGHLTLEWYRTSSRTLSVSIDPSGFIHYAALLGPEKRFGTLPLLAYLPDRILYLARKV